MGGRAGTVGLDGGWRHLRLGNLEDWTVTPRDIARIICCPSGRCISPQECYANDRSRAYPVRIHEAAEALAREFLRDMRVCWAAIDEGRAAAKRDAR